MNPITIKPPPGTPVEWWFIAILAIGLIQVALAAISAKKANGGKSALTVEQEKKLNDLHRWHDTHDDDGVPRWVIGSAMRDAMKGMAEGIQLMVEGQKVTNKLLENMDRREIKQNRILSLLLDRSGDHDLSDVESEDET